MYYIYKIPQVGVAVIPTDTVEILKALMPDVQLLFKGTWQQCMVYMIEPISCN